MAFHLQKFEFQFSTSSNNCVSLGSIGIPHQSFGVDELALRVVKLNGLPLYVIDDLKAQLSEFIDRKHKEYYGKCSSEALLLDEAEFEITADRVGSLYKREVLEYAGQGHSSIDEVHADMYNQVVHSSALECMLSLEQAGYVEIVDAVDTRDRELCQLICWQERELDIATGSFSPDQINALSARHLDDAHMTRSQWESRILAIKNEQRSDFWHWVNSMHERLQVGDSLAQLNGPISVNMTADRFRHQSSTYSSSPVTSSSHLQLPPATSPQQQLDPRSVSPQAPALEESFTIHLGTQLKHMYNLRLVAADVLQLFRYTNRTADQVEPRRVQTVVDLYSSSLCGLVLLVDNRVTSYTGLRRQFASLTERATELHFFPLETQLKKVRSLLSARISSSIVQSESLASSTPRPGDIYVTRHSNLASLHTVLHLVTDDSLRHDVTSRHPVLLALRNAVRLALRSDVTTLSVPLLLSHEFEPHMTVAWCLRRAELVYKCMKGFLMEMASWAGEANRTLQFVLPRNVPDDLFVSLAALLPSIFRLANPLVVKSV